MGVKIYDNESKAFKDAETPLVHDGNLRAWKESTGLVWNDELQAWEERWKPVPNPLWLYKGGDECVDVTGGWGFAGTATVQKNSNNLYISSISYSSGSFTTTKAIDFTQYSKLRIDFSCQKKGESATNPAIGIAVGNLNLDVRITQNTLGERASFDYDVTEITGSHTFSLSAFSTNHSNEYINACFYRAWLEK